MDKLSKLAGARAFFRPVIPRFAAALATEPTLLEAFHKAVVRKQLSVEELRKIGARYVKLSGPQRTSFVQVLAGANKVRKLRGVRAAVKLLSDNVENPRGFEFKVPLSYYDPQREKSRVVNLAQELATVLKEMRLTASMTPDKNSHLLIQTSNPARDLQRLRLKLGLRQWRFEKTTSRTRSGIEFPIHRFFKATTQKRIERGEPVGGRVAQIDFVPVNRGIRMNVGILGAWRPAVPAIEGTLHKEIFERL